MTKFYMTYLNVDPGNDRLIFHNFPIVFCISQQQQQLHWQHFSPFPLLS